jgi:tRNA(Arg) A34 adenosine deaminase TadA
MINRGKKYLMDKAATLAKISYQSNKGLPIGCVITRNGEIIAQGHNEVLI